MKVPWLTGALLSALLSALPGAALADETHIFFGKTQGKIPPAWLKEGPDPSVKIGEAFIVAGDHAQESQVEFSGDEVGLESSNGVWLSRGQGFQVHLPRVSGNQGTIVINYGGPIGVIEVVYGDFSAIPPSQGCSLTVDEAAGSARLPTLDARLGGYRGKTKAQARQLFQPFVSGREVSITNTVTLTARGYDEFFVSRISFYTNYDFASNTTFIDRAEGRKWEPALMTDEDNRKENALFDTFVRDVLQKPHHRRSARTNPTPAATTVTQLIAEYNSLWNVSLPSGREHERIRAEAEKNLRENGIEVLGFLGALIAHTGAVADGFWYLFSVRGRAGPGYVGEYVLKSGTLRHIRTSFTEDSLTEDLSKELERLRRVRNR